MNVEGVGDQAVVRNGRREAAGKVPHEGRRSLLAWLIPAGLLTAGVAYSFVTNPGWGSFDIRRMWETLANLRGGWVALAVLMIYATYFARAMRWRVLTHRVKPDTRVQRLLSATVIGFAAIGVLGRAGELVRPYLVARKEEVPVSGQIGVWFAERVLDVLVLLAMVAFAVGEYRLRDGASSDLENWLHYAGYVVGAMAVTLLLLLLTVRGYYDPLSYQLLIRIRFLPVAQWRRIRAQIKVFGEGLSGIDSLATAVHCLLWSGTVWLLIVGAYAALLMSCDCVPSRAMSKIFVFMGIVMAGSIVQIPGIGGGLQVACVFGLTEVFGLPVEVASGLAILLWVLTFLVVIPPALAFMASEGLRWSKLRELQSET